MRKPWVSALCYPESSPVQQIDAAALSVVRRGCPANPSAAPKQAIKAASRLWLLSRLSETLVSIYNQPAYELLDTPRSGQC